MQVDIVAMKVRPVEILINIVELRLSFVDICYMFNM